MTIGLGLLFIVAGTILIGISYFWPSKKGPFKWTGLLAVGIGLVLISGLYDPYERHIPLEESRN